jgi:hypothetical protein
LYKNFILYNFSELPSISYHPNFAKLVIPLKYLIGFPYPNFVKSKTKSFWTIVLIGLVGKPKSHPKGVLRMVFTEEEVSV